MALDHPKPAAPALEIVKLNKTYGAVPVLHEIDISMDQGEFLVLVGPSGCGKSTLLNCIAGLEEITSGALRIGGREVTQEPPADRDIAMVFQSYALYPTMTVGENIGFGMKIRRVPKVEAQARVAEVARMLQIDHLLDRRPAQLSGGQRQRVAMGRALVRDPRLFLFDEPLSNLDAKLRVEMRAEIKRLHRSTGASIVYVTHDQVEAMTLASRIVVLKGGHVQQIGTPQQIYDTPANTFVADFMGSPPMNLCPAVIEGRTIRVAEHRIPMPPGFGDRTGGVIFGIRPEHLSIGDRPDLTATPTMIENTGSECYVVFDLGGHPMTAKLPGRMDENDLSPIGLTLDHARISLFDPETTRRIEP